MVRLAISSSNYIDLDEYETRMPQYTPTAQVLDHFHQCLNHDGGITTADGRKKPIRPVLLAGADLLSTMNTPGVCSIRLKHIKSKVIEAHVPQVWSEHDLDVILSSRYGAFIVERYGEDLAAALSELHVRPIDILFYAWFTHLQPLEMEGQYLCHPAENTKVPDSTLESFTLNANPLI